MYASLTQIERDFLEKHEVPLSQIFNAAGRTVGACKSLMKDLGAVVAVNTTACGKGGHRMRTRGGHCVVCDSAKLAYTRRHEEPGYVYIAVSKARGLVKIGTTIDMKTRERNLNSYAYGEQKDWVIRHYQKCEKAGRYEFAVQKALASFGIAGRYFKDGGWQDCYELFSCTEKEALEAFAKHIQKPS